MTEHEPTPRQLRLRKKSRIPSNSIFFEKIVPILLIGMAALTLFLILFAIGVLLGFVSF